MRKTLALALLLICGCQEAGENSGARVSLPIAQVPAKDLKVAQSKFPDVKFDTAWKLNNGAIEMRGKNKTGKIHEVEMSPAGEILETN
jgi:hypothetical protein